MDSENILWSSSYEDVDFFFKDLVRREYPAFKFIYKWDDYPDIKMYLERLMYNSYKSSIDIRRKLDSIIHDVEIFFATSLNNGLINEKNLPNILNLLNREDGLRRIGYLEDRYSGVYGRNTNNGIEINRVFNRHSNSPLLSELEIRRLYLFHEIGHKILGVANTDVIQKYISSLDSILKEKDPFKDYDIRLTPFIHEGFDLLEEAMTQEMAEYLTYKSANKERSKVYVKNDMGAAFLTNFDYYGIFQSPTSNFGRTLRGCAKKDSSDEEVTLNMVRKALNGNFTEEVIKEYCNGEAELYYDLYQTLIRMGMLKRKKYASLNAAYDIEEVTASDLLSGIKVFTDKDRDFRDYPVNGFRNTSFDEYIGKKRNLI